MDDDSLVWIDSCIIKHHQFTHLQHVSDLHQLPQTLLHLMAGTNGICCECYWMVHATSSLHCLGTPVFLEEDMAK